MESGERVEVRSAGCAAQVDTLMAQGIPHQQLSGEKSKAEHGSGSQPREFGFEMWRQNSHSGEFCFRHHAAPGKLQGHAAGDQEKGIDPQLAIGKRERPPNPDTCAEFMVVWAHSTMNSDRKSTRLNSSHQIISYAVFCLKKKK